MVATRGYLRHAAVPFAKALAVLTGVAVIMRVTVPGWASFMPYYVALAAPVAYLYVVHRVDCYRSSRISTVVACVLMGVAFALIAQFAVPLESRLTSLIMLALVAPLLEESLKVLPVFTLSRRDVEFEYVLASAVAGFAVGMGFAAGESMVLLLAPESSALLPEVLLAVAVSRALTTTLMHGATAAITSVATSMNRADTPSSVNVSGRLLGFSGAVFLHVAYNVVWITSFHPAITSQNAPGSLAAYSSSIVLWALVVGGLLVTLALVRVGLIEQRRLVTNAPLLERAGVLPDEADALRQLPSLRSFLQVVEADFGSDARRLVRDLLYALTDLLLAVHQSDLLKEQRLDSTSSRKGLSKSLARAIEASDRGSQRVLVLRRDLQAQYDAHMYVDSDQEQSLASAPTPPTCGAPEGTLLRLALRHWKASLR